MKSFGVCSLCGCVAFIAGCFFLFFQMWCSTNFLLDKESVNCVATESSTIYGLCWNTDVLSIEVMIIISLSFITIYHFNTKGFINLRIMTGWFIGCIGILIFVGLCMLRGIFCKDLSFIPCMVCQNSLFYYVCMLFISLVVVITSYKFCIMVLYKYTIQKTNISEGSI